MKKYTPLVFLMVFIVGMVACNKYEYGPNVSLRTKKGRLTNDWELKKVIVNQTDTLNSFDSFEVSFDKDGNAIGTTTYTNTSIGDSTVVLNGEWTFDNDALNLIIIYTDDNGQKDAELYEILQLANDALWLKEMVQTDEYIYQFEEKL